jgi:hypothetical protein
MAKSAGYSGTPLPKKLGIKPLHSVWIVDAPKGFEAALSGLPVDVKLTRSAKVAGAFDVIVVFARTRRELERGFKDARKRLAENGGLWVAWPKKSSGVATELGEAVVRAHGLAQGLVDNKVCAIDETWSGLRFVVRLVNRKRD